MDACTYEQDNSKHFDIYQSVEMQGYRSDIKDQLFKKNIENAKSVENAQMNDIIAHADTNGKL